ncbi:hypothetical protein ACJ72_08235, partial [Emergomyces africanus]
KFKRQQLTSRTPSSTEATFTSLPTESRQSKASLPDMTHYNNLDLTHFPQFFSNLKAKITIDKQAIKNEQTQI